MGNAPAVVWDPAGLIRSLRMGSDRRRRCLHHGPLDDNTGGGVPPQGDEELARQGDDDRLAHPPAKADPLVEPQAERRGRLVALAQSAVNGFSTKPFAAAEPRVVRIMSMSARREAGTWRCPG